MRRLTLQRFYRGPDATLGVLAYPGGRCFTLEEVWRGNEPNVSCIPPGLYPIHRDTFKGRYPNFRLEHVPGRTAIELHIGNTVADTEGCILLGWNLDVRDASGYPRLTSSTVAFEAFMRAMEGIDAAELAIEELKPGG